MAATASPARGVSSSPIHRQPSMSSTTLSYEARNGESGTPAIVCFRGHEASLGDSGAAAGPRGLRRLSNDQRHPKRRLEQLVERGYGDNANDRGDPCCSCRLQRGPQAEAEALRQSEEAGP